MEFKGNNQRSTHFVRNTSSSGNPFASENSADNPSSLLNATKHTTTTEMVKQASIASSAAVSIEEANNDAFSMELQQNNNGGVVISSQQQPVQQQHNTPVSVPRPTYHHQRRPSQSGSGGPSLFFKSSPIHRVESFEESSPLPKQQATVPSWALLKLVMVRHLPE